MANGQKTVLFEVRYTVATAVVTQSVIGSDIKPRTQLFRMGYADRRCKVDQWIHGQIDCYREFALTDGHQIPKFEIIGHELSVKRPTKEELSRTMKRLLTAIEEFTDTTDINSDIGRACDQAQDILDRL